MSCRAALDRCKVHDLPVHTNHRWCNLSLRDVYCSTGPPRTNWHDRSGTYTIRETVFTVRGRTRRPFGIRTVFSIEFETEGPLRNGDRDSVHIQEGLYFQSSLWLPTSSPSWTLYTLFMVRYLRSSSLLYSSFPHPTVSTVHIESILFVTFFRHLKVLAYGYQ